MRSISTQENLLEVCDWSVLRESLREWMPEASDVEACTKLVFAQDLGRRGAHDESGLLQHNAPMLLILEELLRRGWQPATQAKPARVLLNAYPDVFVSTSERLRTRSYFQCLLRLGHIMDLGLARFQHNGTAAYYSLLLRSPTPGAIDISLPARRLAEQLDHLPPDAVGAIGGAVVQVQDDNDVVGSEHGGGDGDDDDSDLGAIADAL